MIYAGKSYPLIFSFTSDAGTIGKLEFDKVEDRSERRQTAKIASSTETPI